MRLVAALGILKPGETFAASQCLVSVPRHANHEYYAREVEPAAHVLKMLNSAPA